MSPTTGLVEGTVCPCCGSGLWRNTDGLYYCTNRNCPERWRSYSLEPLPQPPPQPKKEPVLGVEVASATKTLTSSQQYVITLRKTLSYKSDRHVYRLRQQLGDIQVEQDSLGITLIYRPAGGPQRFPLATGTQEVETNIKLVDIELKGVRPHIDGDVNAQCSGNPLFARCYFRGSAYPQASV